MSNVFIQRLLIEAKKRWESHLYRREGSMYICDAVTFACRKLKAESDAHAQDFEDAAQTIKDWIGDELEGHFGVDGLLEAKGWISLEGICYPDCQFLDDVVSFRVDLWRRLFDLFEVI